jgi:prevent-host-death family protein
MTQNDIVQKLWNLCDVLRDDGINCSDYFTELVLLLFIKREYENTASGPLGGHKLPEYARWGTLSALSGVKLLNHYRDTLLAGTAGFLIAADAFIHQHTDDLYDLSEQQRQFQRNQAYLGMELVSGTRRLALMNCLLHVMEGTAKGGGGPTRDDLTSATSNKQLVFLQHIVRNLKDGGRAAVVLPDNVLFEAGVGADVRRDLMDKCRLHTLLRLPTGIFYAQGVKTNVLFFQKIGQAATGSTDEVWVDDLRANAPRFGKRTPLTRTHFAEFEAAFGEDCNGISQRTDQGGAGRWRSWKRSWRSWARKQSEPRKELYSVFKPPTPEVHPMRYSTQIKSISYLKANAAEVLTQLAQEREPMVITQNGEAKAVIQDVASYEQTQETLALLKILALGQQAVAAGRVKPADEVLARLRATIRSAA